MFYPVLRPLQNYSTCVTNLWYTRASPWDLHIEWSQASGPDKQAVFLCVRIQSGALALGFPTAQTNNNGGIANGNDNEVMTCTRVAPARKAIPSLHVHDVLAHQLSIIVSRNIRYLWTSDNSLSVSKFTGKLVHEFDETVTTGFAHPLTHGDD